ncbi:MAG: hypothetical protein V3T55_10160 [Anaerolineales bacterium]
MSEFTSKKQRIQELLEVYKLDALLLQRVSNFAGLLAARGLM